MISNKGKMYIINMGVHGVWKDFEKMKPQPCFFNLF